MRVRVSPAALFSFQMIIAISIFALLLIISIFFLSRSLSPVPYFPSNKQDIPTIVRAMGLKNAQTLVDLGAGDGIVIFHAAHTTYIKNLSTQFLAVEINPILVFIMHIRRLLHPNRANITILWADALKADLKLYIRTNDAIIVYMYMSPVFLAKLVNKVIPRLKPQTIVSYFYHLGDLKLKKHISAIHNIYIYTRKDLI